MPQAVHSLPPFDIHRLQTSSRLREGAMAMLLAAGAYLLLALLTYSSNDPGWTFTGERGRIENLGGAAGAWFADVAFNLFGAFAILFPFIVAISGWVVFKEGKKDNKVHLGAVALRWGGFLVTLFSGSALLAMNLPAHQFHLPAGPGGIFGDVLGSHLAEMFGATGGSLLVLALFIAGTTLFTGISWLLVIDVTGALTLEGMRRLQEVDYQALLETAKELVQRRPSLPQRPSWRPSAPPPPKPKVEPPLHPPANPASPPPAREALTSPKEKKAHREPMLQRLKPGKRTESEQQPSQGSSAPLLERGLPPLALLNEARQSGKGFSEEALEAMSRQVELKLKDFRIESEVVAVHPGPVVTLFELQLAPGIKAARVTSLSKDLARALATISVRVVEVIPGKSVIGLEIPNEHRETVYLSEILHSEAYDKSKSPLTLALGKNITGRPNVADLAKMPHALIAGTTGSGKSVAINAMILSILYKASPEEVRMIMVDPKMLELSVYEGIPHLLTPVVTDMKEAANALRWCVAEMERRYQLMAKLGVRNISGFNKKIREAAKAGTPYADPFFRPDMLSTEEQIPPPLEPMPYIVVVIDELADMMMVVGKKVEELIARLAQKARAAGIHLLLATQRPSVDVITGLIKANIPTRVAFQVSSRIDSRTILDQMGAEHLLGHGDMLYLPPGTSIPQRLHGAFVDDNEVHEVVAHLKQMGEPDYIDDILQGGGDDAFSSSDAGGGDMEDTDPLFDEAVQIVTETRKASISGVQRRLKIGYNRAARMIEEMERIGVVSAAESNGNRQVLAPPPVEV
jgi:S-DNA-T family DNA segregation ATPase FtsK/SpoIIIE